MKKIFFFMAMSVSLLFSAINVQTASKKELMCIKGVGEKKAEALLKYRKSHKLESVDDLLEIKGFGKVLVSNVKKEIKSVACGGKKSDKKRSKKKEKKKRSDSKEKSSKKSPEKKDSIKESNDKKSSKKEEKSDSKENSDKKSENK